MALWFSNGQVYDTVEYCIDIGVHDTVLPALFLICDLEKAEKCIIDLDFSFKILK